MNNDTKMIEFTPAKYRALKKAYKEAKSSNQLSFVFEGDEWLTVYAYYALQYIESKMGVKS